jgi:hypothetical protein
MKRYQCFLIILILSTFIFSSCDSPSGSKPVSVTKPSLSSPNDNAVNIPLRPTFSWTGEADKFEIAKNINFTTGVRIYDVSGNSFTLPTPQLEVDTRYYWHAGKTSGGDIYWSDEKFTFVTAH